MVEGKREGRGHHVSAKILPHQTIVSGDCIYWYLCHKNVLRMILSMKQKGNVLFGCYCTTIWHFCWTKPSLTKGWNSALVCADHLSVLKMLISLQAAASRLESLCILHAKICISALFLIQEFQSCTIQIVLTWWLYSTLALKIANVTYTFHLSPTSCDQDLGLTKPDKVALFQPWADIYHIYPDMWHWEGQAEPAGRLRPHYHLCLRDIRDFTTDPHGQEICRAAD